MKRLLHFFWFGYQKREGDEKLYQESNAEIQKWAEKLLSGSFTVHSTSCLTQGRVTVSKPDILLGHPTWDVNVAAAGRLGRLDRDWMRDNRLDDGDPSHPNCYMMMPWVPEFPPEWTDFMPCYESQLERAKVIFAICGRIWLDRTLALNDGSIQSRVKDKLVRVNMGVNSDAFTIGKERFNPVGSRKLIHVSSLGSYKGIDLMLDSTRGVARPSIGSRALKSIARGEGELKVGDRYMPFNNLGPVNNDDPAQVRSLVAEHDFYIHTARMDAQATTVLEFAARGLIPIVTPESGFECEDAIYLSHSPEQNREIIRRALQMPDDECMWRSARLKAHVRREHGWQQVFETVGSKIAATCEG